MTPDHTIDARGLLCPLPVLKLRKRLKSLGVGEVLELWADDPAAAIDVRHF
ncbi:MAG: sulfurtransferase TusA family protein, partial [Roseovarius sp.]|nr:sulfurtransferase TusA family protein [Roseovarius sp.]